MPAGVFVKRVPVPLGPRNDVDANHQLLRPDRGREVAADELVHRNAPLTSAGRRDANRRVVQECEQRQLRGWIELTQATADRAAVASLPVPEQRQRLAEDRRDEGKLRIDLERALPHDRADRHEISIRDDRAQIRNPVDINEMIRKGKAHVEHRYERLATG